MGYRSVNWAFDQDQIKNTAARFVLVYMADLANNAGFCYPSRATIARKTSMSVRAAQNAINWLIANEYIFIVKPNEKRKGKRRETNLYRLNHRYFDSAESAHREAARLYNPAEYDLEGDEILHSAESAHTSGLHSAESAHTSVFHSAENDILHSADYARAGSAHKPLDKNKREPLEEEPREEKKPLSAKADRDVVFAYWQAVHGKATHSFTDHRKKAVIARLKKYPVEFILRAIDGCKLSPRHQGFNDRGEVYDDLELICRNDTKLEIFHELYERYTTNTNTGSARTTIPADGKFDHIGTVDYSDFEGIRFDDAAG